MPRFAVARLRTATARLACLALVALAALPACGDLDAADDTELGASTDAVTAGRIVIHADPHQRIAYGFDVKQDGRAAWLDADRAQEIFAADQFDLLRIPVYARRAHPGPDQVDPNDYAPIVNAVQRAQSAAPHVQVFASLRLEPEGASFPGWVTDAGHVQPGPYAHLLMDFLQFMHAQGIRVDYLGPDNESVFNGGDLTPARFADVVQALAARCRNNGIGLPQIVGNDQFGPAGGAEWLRGLRDEGHLALLDVAGVHYYSKLRTPEYRQQLGQWHAAAGARPLWDTEFHWNDDTGGGDFYDAKLGIMTAFDNFDAGVHTVTWWAYNPRSTGTLTAHLHSALVEATVHARPLTTQDHDGAALDEHRFNSRAFSQGDDVTLVVVNDTHAGANNHRVEVAGRAFDHAVTFRRWRSGGPAAGSAGQAERYPERGVFTMDFPAQTITFVRVPNVR